MTSTFAGDHPFEGHPPEGPPADFYESSLRMRIIMIVLTGVNILAAATMATRILWDTRNACMERRRSLRKDDLAVVEEKGGGQKEGDGGGGGGGVLEQGLNVGLETEPEFNARESSKRSASGGKLDTRAWWEMIPTIELFPLILAVTIFVQGIMLAVVEGEGLSRKFFEGNCRFTSEVAWVALWITPYIVLSFTIEAAIRALSQPRFQPRSGKAVLYCILFALILTLLTWIPSRTMPENADQDICSGQLMSFVDQFAAGGLGLMAALLPIAIFMGGVVVMHLTKDVAIDRVEKMASSRTIYFLIINVFQWILMVPNYALTAHNHPKHPTLELATVVANIGGIAAASLHLYLRIKDGSAYGDGKGSSIMYLGSGKSAKGEKEARISESHQNGYSTNGRVVLPSFFSDNSDTYTISEPPRSPTASEHSDLETTSILRAPRSPTSVYSKGHQSSRAPSLFSQYTTHSFKRLGDEINHMIAGLRAADPPVTSKRLPAPPTARKPAFNYTLFPPSADRPRTPHTPISKLQVPIPVRTLSRPPTRPSRATTPIINMDRRQSNYKLLERAQPMRFGETSQALQVPKPIARVGSANPKTLPARPFEVAIPPKVDNADAESFMEILIWKKDETTGENRV